MRILRYQRDNVAAIASSGWPTPTAKANHDAPSMRKWPAYALYHDTAGRPAPVGMDDVLPGRMDALHQLGNSFTPYFAELLGRAIVRASR